MTRDDFERRADDMATNLGHDLRALMVQAYDTLTDDEREKLTDDRHPFFIVRAIGMAVGQRALGDRFDVQAIKQLTPRIKRILNRRGF